MVYMGHTIIRQGLSWYVDRTLREQPSDGTVWATGPYNLDGTRANTLAEAKGIVRELVKGAGK
jgi:hypothetical protein